MLHRKIEYATFDPAELVLTILAILLIVGAVPFTHAWVGALILLTMVKVKITL